MNENERDFNRNFKGREELLLRVTFLEHKNEYSGQGNSLERIRRVSILILNLY